MLKYLRVMSVPMVMLVLFLFPGTLCHAAAKVQVDQAVYEAGTILEGKEVSHEFVLKNIGDLKLTFKPKPC